MANLHPKLAAATYRHPSTQAECTWQWLSPHQHVLGLDGVYSTSADGRVVFTATRAPAQSELLDVTQRVHTRVLRWLKRHGAGVLRRLGVDTFDPVGQRLAGHVERNRVGMTELLRG